MPRFARRAVCRGLAAAVLLLAGCAPLQEFGDAGFEAPFAEPTTAALEAPLIETGQDVDDQATLLERYTDACNTAERERNRADVLNTRLDKAQAGLKAAQEDVTRLENEVRRLTKQRTQLEHIAKEYEQAQEQMLTLGNTVRDLRHKLLKEQLTRVKLEQTILNLRIEMAKARRRDLLKKTSESVSYNDQAPEAGDAP